MWEYLENELMEIGELPETLHKVFSCTEANINYPKNARMQNK